MTVDYADWATSQDHADKISTTGAPLINLRGAAGNNTTIVAAGASTQIGPLAVGQIGYELSVEFDQSTAAGGAVVGDITFTWQDSITGLILAVKSFQTVSGANGTPHSFKIRGPARGNQVTLTFANNSQSTTGARFVWQLLNSSRIYPRDVIRTTQFQQSGFSGIGSLIAYGVVGHMSTSVGAGGTITRLLAAYSGKVYIAMQTSGANNTAQIQVIEAATAVPLIGSGAAYFSQRTSGLGLLSDQFSLSGVQAQLQITNLDTAPHTITCMVSVDASGE